jgi:hypothetical protein
MNRFYHFAFLLLVMLFFNIAVADTEEKDTETLRFETELRNR